MNFINGTVQIIDGGKKTQANIGDAVKEGMKIETSAQSFAEIYIGENAIKILENSLIEVRHLFTDRKNNEMTEFYVGKGRLFSRVQKKLIKGEEYTIKTPTAVASVRGTEFMVLEKDGKGNIACLNGKIEVASDDKKVEIGAGQEVEVEKGKAPMVREISEDNKKNMQDILQNFKEMREDIRKNFETQRAEILRQVEDTRAENKKAVDEVREAGKKDVEDQKAADKTNIDAIKGGSDETKNTNKDEVGKTKEGQKKLLDNVKPDMNEFKKGLK